MPKLFIPRLSGDYLKLTKAWEFKLYNEYRNSSLIEHLGIQYDEIVYSRVNPSRVSPVCVSLPEGIILKVDRYYIRNGKSEYDSLTFRIAADPPPELVFLTKLANPKPIRRGIRFWVKIEDVNKIEYELVDLPKTPRKRSRSVV